MGEERKYSVSLELGLPEGTKPIEAIQAIADGLKGSQARLIMLNFEEIEQRGAVKTFPPDISDTENKLEALKNLLADPSTTQAPIYNTRQIVGFFPGLKNDNLYYWERRGKIHPESMRSGSKSYRRYPLVEVVRAGLIWQYEQSGMLLDGATQHANRDIQNILEPK